MGTKERESRKPEASRECFTHIGNWKTPYGLIYGEFEDKEQPGVEFFGQFKDMVREIDSLKKVKPRSQWESAVEYKGMVLHITHRINEFGSDMQDDYEVVEGDVILDSLKDLVRRGRLKPFWIEIQNNWMNILYSRGKKRYMTQIVALEEPA